ncbi:30S ribosomal protein S6 [Limnospira sp. Paracas R14]|uniref:30S ribosomal protein S6 n=1 Tax=Limnospira sp. Paracas R14 TaxID=2981108 RepID=UPI0028E11A20|nr:30S ribosomal protein S6 [Limnospira sp. Paracas R14]
MKPFIYETMYILRSDLNEEQLEAAIAKYQDILREHGAQNLDVQNLGKRRLAYDIDKHREGIYIQMNYEGGDSDQIKVMERAMRIGGDVIRYLTIKQDVTPSAVQVEAEPEAEPQEV